MEHYCKRCEAMREFRLEEEGQLENVYVCYSCGMKWKQKTAGGWAVTFGSIATAGVLGLLFGHGHHDPNPPTRSMQ